LGEKCITLEVDGARQRGRLRITWQEVLDKDMNYLHLITKWCCRS